MPAVWLEEVVVAVEAVVAVVVEGEEAAVCFCCCESFNAAWLSLCWAFWWSLHFAAKFRSAAKRSPMPPDEGEAASFVDDEEAAVAVFAAAVGIAAVVRGTLIVCADASRDSNRPDKAPPAPRLEFSDERKFAAEELLSALAMEGLVVVIVLLSQAVL
jgi:hypothetical protein